MKYNSVIGLEIHCELLTDSKVFCSCKNDFGANANTHVCPRCAGFPGTLPTLNKGALFLAAKAGFATDCTVNNYSAFDRKNYFYPDLPKSYQITQFEYPICSDGYVELKNGKKIRISRIHIEEDAGKLIHDDNNGISLADYNRCGVPLIEIVTEPDFENALEVNEFVGEIAKRLQYADVCDARMEQGSLRVDVNISLMPVDSVVLGTRAEIKNLNSLKAVSKAIEYEIKRQSEILDSGERVIQETRRFDDNSSTTLSLRSKEEAHDHRYFPEPDIPPVILTDNELEEIKASMPEMPHIRYRRYLKYGLSDYEANLLTQTKEFSDFFDSASKIYPSYKSLSNMMLGEISRYLNDTSSLISELRFSPSTFAELIKMSDEGLVSGNSAKNIIKIMFENGKNPREIAEEEGFLMSNDTSAIEAVIDKILSENTDGVSQYKSGNQKVFGFFMGQLMREIGKSANPTLAKEILLKKLQ